MKERFGDEVFQIMAGWPARRVDKFIEALFIPFDGSKYAADEAWAKQKGKTTIRFDAEALRIWKLNHQMRDPMIYMRRIGTRRTVG